MEFFKIKEEIKAVKETKCTCVECGKIWHFNKKDIFDNNLNKISNSGKAMSCCSGCVPVLLVPDKKVTDFKRCPSCSSQNVKFEEVVYEVTK